MSDHSWPLDHALYVASAADTVRRLRSHACVALWCGGNEQVPAADLDAALRAMLPQRPLGDIAPSGEKRFGAPHDQMSFVSCNCISKGS